MQAAGDSAAPTGVETVGTAGTGPEPGPAAYLLSGGLDTAGLGLLVLLAVLGFSCGLWWQVVRLLGLVAAALVARTLGPRLGEVCVASLPEVDERVLHGVAWLTVFLAALAAAALLGKLGKRVLEALQLGLVDRVGGAVAGAATGVVLQAVIVLGLARLAPEPWVERHVAGSHSERLVSALAGDVHLLLDDQSWIELADLLEGAPVDALPPGTVEAAPPEERDPPPRPRVR